MDPLSVLAPQTIDWIFDRLRICAEVIRLVSKRWYRVARKLRMELHGGTRWIYNFIIGIGRPNTYEELCFVVDSGMISLIPVHAEYYDQLFPEYFGTPGFDKWCGSNVPLGVEVISENPMSKVAFLALKAACPELKVVSSDDSTKPTRFSNGVLHVHIINNEPLLTALFANGCPKGKFKIIGHEPYTANTFAQTITEENALSRILDAIEWMREDLLAAATALAIKWATVWRPHMVVPHTVTAWAIKMIPKHVPGATVGLNSMQYSMRGMLHFWAARGTGPSLGSVEFFGKYSSIWSEEMTDDEYREAFVNYNFMAPTLHWTQWIAKSGLITSDNVSAIIERCCRWPEVIIPALQRAKIRAQTTRILQSIDYELAENLVPLALLDRMAAISRAWRTYSNSE